MRIFKTKIFARFARRAVLADAALCEAVARTERGLLDADLGGGVIKQRIARQGEGKSGGFRTIVLFRASERAVFAYGFEKNDRDNIEDDELADFRKLAALLLVYDDGEIEEAWASGALVEVNHGEAIS